MGWTWDAVPQKRFLLGLLMLVSVTLPCAVIYQIASMPEIQRAVSSRTLKRDDPLESDSDEIPLQALLRKAAMIDNTVILTTVNEAWAAPGSVLDIFLESFRTGDRTERLLKHLVIVALDQKAYLKCKSTHSLCYALKTEGVDFSHEKFFMTPDYLKMMWRRIDFLRIVLEMGYDFIFTDSDIVWFRDPSLFLYPDGDFQIACDYFNGHPDDRRNSPNGGFNYARANNRTIEFYKFWYESKEKHPGYHDQDVLNFIKDDQRLHAIGLNMKFLPTASFGGLCQPSMDFDKVCTMHTNCCVGVERKVNDLKVMLEDWRMYRDQKPSVKGRLKPRWKVPQKCSLDMRH